MKYCKILVIGLSLMIRLEYIEKKTEMKNLLLSQRSISLDGKYTKNEDPQA